MCTRPGELLLKFGSFEIMLQASSIWLAIVHAKLDLTFPLLCTAIQCPHLGPPETTGIKIRKTGRFFCVVFCFVFSPARDDACLQSTER